MRCPARFALLVLASCASTTPASTATSTSTSTPTATPTPISTTPPPPTAFTRALAAARDARDRAANLLAPRYDGNGGKESVAAFVAGPIKQWFDAKRVALELAERAYLAAAHDATTPEDRVLALSELVPLWSDFCDDMVRGTPVPIEWREDPERVKGYVDGIAAAQEPVRARARAHADRCVDEVRAASLDTPPARRCVELRARFQRR